MPGPLSAIGPGGCKRKEGAALAPLEARERVVYESGSATLHERPDMQLLNLRTGKPLGDRVERAVSFRARSRGLLGRPSLEGGEGLWIEPCASIHMFFMRFAIDAVFVDSEGRVVRSIENLKPWRIAFGGRHARAVIELPAGTVSRSGTQLGDTLELQ